jgi:hypothetical protein
MLASLLPAVVCEPASPATETMFLARTAQYQLFITGKEAVFASRHGDMRMQLIGARKPERIIGLGID